MSAMCAVKKGVGIVRIPLGVLLLVLAPVLQSEKADAQPIQLVNAFPSLTFTQPVLLTHANDGTNRVFVVQQNGLIRVFPNDSAVTNAPTFLNIANKLNSGSERGLLGLAFHPNYANNGYFYVNYTTSTGGPSRTVVSRFSVMPGNPNKADSLSEFVILQVNQPYSNHNAGDILFGLDGYLYITMGDGGSGGDPENRAQNLDSLLGKILRINVDTVTATTNYGIPPTNPLVGNPNGYREELYAWGLRNPWRFSMDPATGRLWVGDVGQNAWEEIDVVQGGKNYGWRCYEGNSPYNLTGCGPAAQYTFPIRVYPNAGSECAVTGGHVYRGHRRADLVGAYIYADYCSGKIWKLRYDGISVSDTALLIDAPFSISSFGVDQLGELYICNYSNGNIQRFAGPPPTVSTTLVSPSNGSQNIPVSTMLVWRQAFGAVNYWLEVADNAGFTPTLVQDSLLTDTSFALSSLNPSAQYFWRVKVRNAIGWGSFSAAWSFTTVPPPPTPPALVGPPNGASGIPLVLSLEWAPVAGASQYNVQVAEDSLFQTPIVDDTVAASAVQIGPLSSGMQHHWRVRGMNAGGTGNWSEVWSFTTVVILTNNYAVAEGWNIVSLPLTVEDTRASVLFPGAASAAFGYGGTGYIETDSLSYGKGYWLKFETAGSVTIVGVAREEDSLTVVPGWNLIGAISQPVDVASVVQIPPGILSSSFYEYNGVYVEADSLHPGAGYWVKSIGTGVLVLTNDGRFTPALGTPAARPPFMKPREVR